MSDLIDREALLRQIDIDSEGEPGYYGDTWKFIDTIKRMPSALSTNLAEVGTDVPDTNVGELISRQAAIDALDNDKAALDKIIKGMSAEDMLLKYYVAQHNQVSYDIDAIVQLPPIQPADNLQKLADEIASFKRHVKSDNSDYLTGYLCALSVVEGMIADMRQKGENSENN